MAELDAQRIRLHRYAKFPIDDRHRKVLDAAYRADPEYFLEVFDLLIDGENEQAGNGFILDRILPICPGPIELLRAKLGDPKLKRRMFEKILGLRFKRATTTRFKSRLISWEDAAGDPEVKLDRLLAAASQLLVRNVRSGWQVIWPAVQLNVKFV